MECCRRLSLGPCAIGEAGHVEGGDANRSTARTEIDGKTRISSSVAVRRRGHGVGPTLMLVCALLSDAK